MRFFSRQLKRNSSSPSMIPSTNNNNTSMPFSVTDILQPLDMDVSASYKRSLEMAHALASSSSAGAYNLSRPTASVTPNSLCNSTFTPSSAHHNYYNPAVSSTSTFSPNHQYYDYASSIPTNGATSALAGQYSPSSCWYGSAASR